MFPTPSRLDLLQSNLQGDLLIFLPELVLSAGIVLLLLLRLVKAFDRSHLGNTAVAVIAVALLPAVNQFTDAAGWTAETPLQTVEFFTGMMVTDAFSCGARVLLLAAALVTVILTLLTGLPDRDDSGDFHALLLGGTLGMLLMASANHLMMVFIAVEMASLPSYALAGFLKGKRQGSEAALKYVVFGAGASGVMLYGISLLAGTFGTGNLINLANAMALRSAESGGLDPLCLTGLALVLVGLGFKLSAFPFHFWCPDVFEGAAAEVAGFLSVASKTAAVALTVRFMQTLQLGADHMVPSATSNLLFPSTVGIAIGVFGAITVTFGNLAAFAQKNLKRMLAYSTIAHAGYMLLGIAAIGVLDRGDFAKRSTAPSALLYYLIAYLFMNLGAFAVVAFVRNKTGSENIDAFRGLVRKSPVLAIAMSIFLFSLLGLPPLAGFAGKFQVFDAVYEAGKAANAAGENALGSAYYVLLGIGAVNTAASAYYYLRVVRAMLLEEDPNPNATCSVCASGSVYLSVLAAALLAAGIFWNPVQTATDAAARPLAPFSVKVRPEDIPERIGPAKKLPPPVANPGPKKGGNPKKKGPDA